MASGVYVEHPAAAHRSTLRGVRQAVPPLTIRTGDVLRGTLADAPGTTAYWRAERGLGKPETFDFLGFTHLCGNTKKRRFWVRRVTIAKRIRAKLAEVKVELRRRRHWPIPEQVRWLASVVRGHRAYYAVPGNTDAIQAFRTQVTRHWYQALRRRSQRTRITWARMNRYAQRWLPPARAMHPFPDVRLTARTRGKSPVR